MKAAAGSNEREPEGAAKGRVRAAGAGVKGGAGPATKTAAAGVPGQKRVGG
jgi:hypothetical protein